MGEREIGLNIGDRVGDMPDVPRRRRTVRKVTT
jgi:hypothetical protein